MNRVAWKTIVAGVVFCAGWILIAVDAAVLSNACGKHAGAATGVGGILASLGFLGLAVALAFDVRERRSLAIVVPVLAFLVFAVCLAIVLVSAYAKGACGIGDSL